MKQIVFLEPWTTPMIHKISKMLRNKGYYTVLITILGNENEEDLKEVFDEVISFNLKFYKINLHSLIKILFSLIKKSPSIISAIYNVLKLNPYVIITRSQPNWPCALTRYLFDESAIIYFPYDIRSQDYNLKEIKNANSLEIKAERYCFENADGIMHKGSDNELKYLNKNILGNLKICSLQLHLPPYCSKEFIVPLNNNKLSKKDKEIHMVVVASMTSAGAKEYLNEYGEMFNEMAKNKIHVHTYIRPNLGLDIIKSFEDVGYKKILDLKYFHLHQPLEQKELTKEISKYDYGLMLLGKTIEKSKKPDSSRFLTGNKIASYLEAGIPFFYSKKFEYINKIMEGYGLGFIYNGANNTSKMKKLIQKQDYKKIEKNILKARQDFLMEKHFPELENFIENVAKSRMIQNAI